MTSYSLQRREFLSLLASSALLSPWIAGEAESASSWEVKNQERFFFQSHGKLGLMTAGGTGLRYLKFDVPNQSSWEPGPFFSDGRRVILLSMQEVGHKPESSYVYYHHKHMNFSKYYHRIPIHLWIYDFEKGSLNEIARKERLAPFYAPCVLLPGDEQMIVQVVFLNGQASLYRMDLDGAHKKQLTRPDEGFPYGVSLSPDGKRIAFHVSGPPPNSYRVFDCKIDGSDRILVAGREGHLYFGTSWSPAGDWILYEDCHYKTDPGHDWSDVCVGRPDGSENRVLTKGQSQWFAATYGNPKNHGDGSNVPQWRADGSVLYERKLPGSRPAWQYQPQRPDIDHFNRDYKPEQARGGTEICSLNPISGSITRLTHSNPPQWDFRARPSPDGKKILFCRARTGGVPAIWVMNSDGTRQRMLTRGWNGQGADQPRWLGSAEPN